MTETEQKALELVNAGRIERGQTSLTDLDQVFPSQMRDALCRAIEAHQSDKSRHAAELREQAERFSEAAREVINGPDDLVTSHWLAERLSPFILPAPDPLVAEVRKVAEGCGLALSDEQAETIAKYFLGKV